MLRYVSICLYKFMEEKESHKQDFTVLEDKPLESGESDIFGHGEIANSVIEIIRKAPRPFNIGIYGQWGVGKSTICKLIEDGLNNEKKYEVLYFDTWKYERDSFRRQFLISLDQKLNLGLNYKETLNQSLSVPFNLSWFDSLKASFGSLLFRSVFLIIVALVVIIIFRQSILPLLLSEDYIGIAKRVIDLGVIGILLTFISDTIKQVNGEKVIDKTDSAEGFEEHFVKALAEIKNNDLLVIIDNLDRLSSEKAVNLLSDIKTFLSDEDYSLDGKNVNNRTVFVIPCDNKAINDQLLKEYGDNFDTEEYLRKFFNHSIQIPKFLNIELDDFIVRKLNTTQIPEFKDNYDLVFILSYAFRNNPREIIQFINSLISLYLLAKERGIEQIIKKEHVAFLAKVLVLRVKWPKSYSKIEDRVLRTGDKLSEIVSKLHDDEQEEKKKIEEFLRVTSHIDDDEAQDIYFSLRQSDAQKTVPEWNSFVLSLIEGRKQDAEKIYNTVKSADKLSNLGQLMADYCRRHMRNENLLFNIFITVHKIITPEDLKHFQEVVHLTFKNAGSGKFKSAIDRIDLSKMFSKGLDGVSPANKKNFSQNLVVILSNIAVDTLVERNMIKNVRKLFEIVHDDENKDNFKNKRIEIIEAKKNFIRHLRLDELFPDAEKSDKFRKDILDDILSILTTLGPTTSEYYSVGLTLFDYLLRWQPIVEVDNVRLEVLKQSLEFLEKSGPPTSGDGGVGTILNAFTSTISFWYSANKSAEEKALCVKIFQKVNLTINKEPASWIRRYIIENANTADTILQTLGKDFLTNDENARTGLMFRSRVTLDLLSKLPLKRKLSDEEKADIFANLVVNENEALAFLEYVGYSVPAERSGDPNFLKNIVLRMINAGAFSDTDLLTKWIDAISRLGVQPDQVDAFVQKLRQVRTLSEPHKQAIASFVSKNSKDFGDLVVKEFNE
ncbi:MAG: P-loop NTPase fold protein [Minisyncoccia bacterium]